MKGIVIATVTFLVAATFGCSRVTQPETSSVKDQQQSWGGWGRDCKTQFIECNNGREISCYSNVDSNSERSSCTQHWGREGWVSCSTYDRAGNQTSSFFDECR